MHIYYDIEIYDSFNINKFSPKLREILEVLKDFLNQRFAVLKEEMGREWTLYRVLCTNTCSPKTRRNVYARIPIFHP